MELYLYKVRFKIQILCCGIISYAEGHTSVVATSEEEAKKKVKENIIFTYYNTETINQIDFLI